MTRLIIIGPPGSGKGTQAEHIAAHFNVPAISTGDIFRSNVREQTQLGDEATRFLDRGEFVPDDVTNAMVRERLADADANGGFLLDGYPRNTSQVEALDAMLAESGNHIDGVVLLLVDDDELTARMLNRAREQGRSDDTAEVIRRRLELYRTETAPVVDLYSERGIVADVDGSGTPAEVTDRAVAAVERLLER
ncbi:adenylate kinase [Arthrobacter sp. M4]|uniref:adenylate kinase n=1 Tax=Arthrobacter sp. M4 TaxID=218160 RepID=UPI001CDCE496|nr:adenylate kinase [Arthrobacter sp. M4]MCA4135018.1 adenylate kinase [Arthrobacter sp. M4]